MPAPREAKRNEPSQTRFVIIVGQRPRTGFCTHYLSTAGTRTALRSEAARFYFFEDAKDFAKRLNIALSRETYIGRENFTDSELEGYYSGEAKPCMTGNGEDAGA